MGIQEHLDKSSRDRGAMIDLYTPLYITAKDISLDRLYEQRDEAESFLFTDSTYIGIHTLITLYWDNCIALRNNSGSYSANLTSSLIRTWTFDNPVYEETDGSLKTPISDYITDNNLSLGGTSVYQYLIDFIGTAASGVGEHISSYIYATQSAAQIAMAAYDDARNGSGLLGNRTKDSSPQDTDESGGLWRFEIGDGTIDTPDYWSATLYTNIDTLLSNLTSLKNNILDDIQNFYDTLNDNPYIINKTLFSSFDSERVTFSSAITSQINSLNTYKSDLQILDDNLSGNRATINSTLISFVSDLNSWKSTAENRISAISSGNTIFGNVETPGTINYYRETILSTLNSFPDGIIEIIRLTLLESDASDIKLQKEDKKSIAYGINAILKPTMIRVNFTDKTKTAVSIRWNCNQYPNQYKIYRRLVSAVTNNNEWPEDDLLTTITYLTNEDPETGWTAQYYIDDTVDPNKNYVYRVLAIDNYWSSHGVPCNNSQSDQSDVWESGEIIRKART